MTAPEVITGITATSAILMTGWVGIAILIKAIRALVRTATGERL